MRKSLFSASLALFLSTPVLAAEPWQLKEAPAGTAAKWVAEVKNAQGDTLRVYRKIGRSGYEAFAEFTLASGKKFSKVMPLYQIDNGKVEDTAVAKRLGETLNQPLADIKSNQANWRIWTSPTPQIDTDSELMPWIRGNNLLIKYKTPKDKEKNSTFSLKGSGKAIKTAITGAYQ